MVSDFEMRYNRFIQDSVIFLMKNRNKSSSHYFNIYFDDGVSWIKVEPHNYYDLLSRAFTKEKIIDPVLSFTVAEINWKLTGLETEADRRQELDKFLRSEILMKSFEIWEEFS